MDLWQDILHHASTSRQAAKSHRRILVCPSAGTAARTHSSLNQPQGHGAAQRGAFALAGGSTPRQSGLALGYGVLQSEEGDEESFPPISVYYAQPDVKLRDVLPAALPSASLSDSTVVLVLDWALPSRMLPDLLEWTRWLQTWASEDGSDHLQALIQHYVEPTQSASASASSAYTGGPLLPLGPGTLTLNPHGIPLVVVCANADLMDAAGDSLGLKGTAWEERCDWVQQVLRTICLAYGAALFYTFTPTTHTLLRSYLIHRLHGAAPPTPGSSNDSPAAVHAHTARFPFPHRANVLDKDAVLVPTGWDSWGKIKVLREGFDPATVLGAWEQSLSTASGGSAEVGSAGLEGMWKDKLPDVDEVKPTTHGLSTHVEPEQSFLARHYETLTKDPNRDPRAAFRAPAGSTSASSGGGTGADAQASLGQGQGQGQTSGVVGPVGAGGLSLPGVEKAMAEMEGRGAEDLKDKFARMGKKEPGAAGDGKPNEALHNFFQGLLATKGKSAAKDKASKTPPPSASAAAPTTEPAPAP